MSTDRRTNGSGPPALEVRNLTGGYGTTTVLRDVTISVERSSVVALLGPNGAGKTTLLEMVAGSLRPTTGQVVLDGSDVTSTPTFRRIRSGLCHVPEGRAVYRGLSVRENLLMQADTVDAALAQERAVEAFPVLGRRIDQIAGTLSGGEQQMLAMCAAYVRTPSMVLIDEASLGLAPLIVDEVFSGIEALKRAGAAILLVDQYASRALELSSRGYVMRQGRIVLQGSAVELRETDLFSEFIGN